MLDDGQSFKTEFIYAADRSGNVRQAIQYKFGNTAILRSTTTTCLHESNSINPGNMDIQSRFRLKSTQILNCFFIDCTGCRRGGCFLMIGTTLGHDRVVEKIGACGMGIVYTAEDTRLHRHVALKLPPEEVSNNLQVLEKDRRLRHQSASDMRADLQRLKRDRDLGRKAVPTAPEAAAIPSIAVLPFVNMSGDTEQEYFSDGLAEEVINLLAHIPGLPVIARTSAFAFKGRNEDVRKIAAIAKTDSTLRVRPIRVLEIGSVPEFPKLSAVQS